MSLPEIRIRTKLTAEAVAEMEGKMLREEDISYVIGGGHGPARVLMPDGRPLAVYLPGVIPVKLRDSVYPTLHSLKNSYTSNRGKASGSQRAPGASSRSYARMVDSAIVGAFDPAGPKQYCRLSAWSREETERWPELFPLFKFIGKMFAEYVPDRYAAQARQAARTAPEWVIPGTPFTTITVNNCVDEATECLSKTEGWTTHDRLKPGDEILAYDPDTHTTRWEPLQDVFVNESYKGDMVLLSNSRFSALTTPDHRWPVRRLPERQFGSQARTDNARSLAKRGPKNPMWGRRKHPAWKVCHSQDLPGSGWALARSAPHEAPLEPHYEDAFVRLAAWYYTEGGWGEARIGISQCFKANPENVAAIRADIEEMGIGKLEAGEGGRRIPGRRGLFRREGLWYREGQANQWPNMVGWEFQGEDVQRFTDCIVGKEKVPSMEFLTALTQEQLHMFIDTAIAGDGWGTGPRYFSQASKARMDAFVAAAVLAGMAPSSGSFKDEGANGYGVALNESFPLIWLEAVQRKRIAYKGLVWCPQIPSGHWVARRHGRTFITGNTYPTGVHTDKGDLDEGFSTLATLRRGEYTGGLLCFPEYSVGVDMQDGDLLLMDAHQWHGNTPMLDYETQLEAARDLNGRMVGDPGYERISIVSYFRTKMTECGSAADEAERQRIYAENRNAAMVGE